MIDKENQLKWYIVKIVTILRKMTALTNGIPIAIGINAM